LWAVVVVSGDFCADAPGPCTHFPFTFEVEDGILRGLQQVALGQVTERPDLLAFTFEEEIEACERCDGPHWLCTEHLAVAREIGAQDAEDAQREVGT